MRLGLYLMKKRFVTLDEKLEQATWSWLRFARVYMLTRVRRIEEYVERGLLDESEDDE